MNAPRCASVIAECLPAGWRLSGVRREGATLVIASCDPEGRDHAFEIRRANPSFRAFVSGKRCAFSYRDRLDANAATTPIHTYRVAFSRMAAREDEIAKDFDGDCSVDAAGAPAGARRHALWFESDVRLWTLGHRSLRDEAAIRRRLDDLGCDVRVPVQLHFYFETNCSQACQFCQVPIHRSTLLGRVKNGLHVARNVAQLDVVSTGIFDAIVDDLGSRAPSSGLTITGHDWARTPKLDLILRRFEREARVEVSFLGPSTRLADPVLADRISALPTLGTVTLTLQSMDLARHDRMVGAPGSGAQVMQAVDNLRARGIRPLVSTVLTSDALAEIPALLRWVEREGLVLGLQAFIPDRGPAELAACLPHMDSVRAALANALEWAPTSLGAINRVPLCAIPPNLRSRSMSFGQSSDREETAFPVPCRGCSLRAECPGVPAGYVRRFGAAGLVAEPTP